MATVYLRALLTLVHLGLCASEQGPATRRLRGAAPALTSTSPLPSAGPTDADGGPTDGDDEPELGVGLLEALLEKMRRSGELANTTELDLSGLWPSDMDVPVDAGPIPEWLGTATWLTKLDLSNNLLSGGIPESLGNLAELRVLRLGLAKQLTGRIPPALGSLALLEELDLSGNSLEGTIPPSLGNLSQLRILRLRANQLAGTIPEELSGLARLEELDLSWCSLSGTIPPSLAKLSQLKRLQLRANDLTGAIPPELGSISALQELFLSSNALGGPIPSELGRLSNLRVLDLHETQLSGSIPAALGNLSALEKLTLAFTSLSGALPAELGRLSRLRTLNLNMNFQLTGPIPAAFSGLAALESLSVSQAALNGSIPEELCQLANLSSLALDQNRLSGVVPPCLGRLANLSSLYLSGNAALGGRFPDTSEAAALTGVLASGCGFEELGELGPNVESVDFSRNKLRGLPSRLSDHSHLQELLLFGNQLQNISIEPPSQLRTVRLGGNNLTSIAPGWLNLSLAELDVQANPYLHVPVLPAEGESCPDKEDGQLRADPAGFEAVEGTNYECTGLCRWPRQGPITVDSWTFNATSLCRCLPGSSGSGTSCMA